MSSSQKADVLIIGGGLVGGTLACCLAYAGLHVAVVDQHLPQKSWDAHSDSRALAISYGSRNLLHTLGLWSSLEKHAQPILDIHVSQEGSLEILKYASQEIGDHPLGYIIAAHYLREGIYAHAVSFSNIYWYAPHIVQSLNRGTASVEAHLENNTKIKAALCIAADGRRSQTRRQAGIPITSWGYDQTAIVCTIEHEKPHKGIAYEHFLPNGPFAVLPFQGQRSSIVWSERSENVPFLMTLKDQPFSQEIQKRFGNTLGKIQVRSQRWSYPLSASLAHSYIHTRLALVGDAAHVMHPVAGQGLNMGLRDNAALAEVIIDTYRLGLDIGSMTALERYQRWRRFDNMTFVTMTDGLVRLFSNHSKLLKHLRGAGLSWTHHTPFLKRFLMRHAMGLVGDLPRLIAGKPL